MIEKVSVVIPSYRQIYLSDTLNSLARQTNRNFEVIVIENGIFSHETHHLIDSYRASIDVRWYFEPSTGTNRARNIGTQYANNDIIAIIDDDVVVDSTWIEEILKAHIAYPYAGVIGGRVNLRFLHKRPKWCIGNFARRLAELNWGDRVQELTNWRYLVSANMSYRKKIFDVVGGFSEDPFLIGGNDTYNDEFTFTENAKLFGDPGLLYVPDITVTHQIPPDRTTLAYMQRRAYAQGISDVALYKFRFPQWSQHDLLRLWEEQLYGQEWNYEEMQRDRMSLSDCDAEIFTEYFLSCRVFYLQGIGDMIRNRVNFSQFRSENENLF